MTGNVLKEIEENIKDYEEQGIEQIPLSLVKYWISVLGEDNKQLLSDKEHLMGYLIRFRSFDDEDIDYVMNRESNREYGKQYYEMKEEDW